MECYLSQKASSLHFHLFIYILVICFSKYIITVFVKPSLSTLPLKGLHDTVNPRPVNHSPTDWINPGLQRP